MGLRCIYSVLLNLPLLLLFLRLHDLDSVYHPEWWEYRLSTGDTRIYRKVPGQDVHVIPLTLELSSYFLRSGSFEGVFRSY